MEEFLDHLAMYLEIKTSGSKLWPRKVELMQVYIKT